MRKLAASIVTLFGFVVAMAGTASSAHAQDAAAGEKKATLCVGCHNIPRYQASFPEVHKVPMIAGQSAQYIVAALNAYKKGDRKHPTMRSLAITLSDQDIADLGAYYAQLGKTDKPLPETPRQPSAEVAELLNKTNCASCHGANFSTPIDPSYAKLAGQHADYLYVALKTYQIDNNPVVGRNNAIMAGMARQYTPAQLKALADYLASLDGELKTVELSELR